MAKRQTLRVILLAGAVGLSGCDKRPMQYIEGIVQKEAGTIVDRKKILERSEGTMFENDDVRLNNPTYAIQFKTDDGKVYTFSVMETYHKRLEALNLAIEEGTRIRIAKPLFEFDLKGTVGQIRDYDLEVL